MNHSSRLCCEQCYFLLFRHLNSWTCSVSSSPADFFGYLFSVIEIFFSLPGSAHQRSASTDALDGPRSRDLQSPLPSNPLVPLRGVHRVMRATIQELCESMMNAVEKYATLSISREYGIDMDDPAFNVFHFKHVDVLDCATTLDSVFRRVNNLVHADHLLSTFLERKIKLKVSERGGLDMEAAEAPLIALNAPSQSPDRDEIVLQRIFQRGHDALHRATTRLLLFAGKFIAYRHFRDDLVLGVYIPTMAVSASSFSALRPVVEEIIEALAEVVGSDQLLAGERDEEIYVMDTIAYRLLVSMFVSIAGVVEMLVVGDPQAGRKLEARDVDVVRRDIEVY